VKGYGVKQDVWEINYALWGLMMAAIGISYKRAVQIAGAWKFLKMVAFGEPNPCRDPFQMNYTVVEWINTGYQMYDLWFWETPSDVFHRLRPTRNKSKFAKCSPCGQNQPGPVSYQLLDDLGGSNAPPRR
jgi:hypothetical protein